MSARVRPRLILADDSSVIREAIGGLLRLDYDIVAAVHDGAELVEAAGRLHPDAIVTDMEMPRLSGLLALRRLRSEGSTAKFVFGQRGSGPCRLGAGRGGLGVCREGRRRRGPAPRDPRGSARRDLRDRTHRPVASNLTTCRGPHNIR